MTTALLTDHYELTMLRAALADGTAEHRCVFEVFARSLPAGRRYGVVAGLGRLVEALDEFSFSPGQLDWLQQQDVIDAGTRDYLTGWRFGGDIDGYREGELYFPHSPVLTVSGTFAECVLLETLVLSVLNADSAIASAAARMVGAAGDRPLLEMGSRRTGERSAVACARAAYLAGFAATSNLEAGFRHGVPTRGTAAHAFTLAHPDELSAFTSQVATLGAGTTLLVDTYDIPAGIANAVQAAGPGLGAIRIDSGDLHAEAVGARALLDGLGATGTRIVVTGDLDEHAIAGLAGAPVDVYGAGTKLVTGSGHPTAGMVYKLVAVADSPAAGAVLRPVAKRSTGKRSVGGRKVAFRQLDADGRAVAELVHPTGPGLTGLTGLTGPTGTSPTCPAGTSPTGTGRTGSGRTGAAPAGDSRARALQVPVVRAGTVVHRPTLSEVRAHHRAAMAELRPADRSLAAGHPRLSAAPETPPAPTAPTVPTVPAAPAAPAATPTAVPQAHATRATRAA